MTSSGDDCRQEALTTVPEAGWDVIVVGAGPAGSMAALDLAEAGLRVLMVDRHAFPREKVCGDALIPDAIAVLRRKGLWDEVRAAGFWTERAVVFSPSRHRMAVPGEYLTVKRVVLDHILARAAVRRGAVFAEGKATDVRPEDGGVAVAFEAEPRVFRSRLAILATGADVALPDRLGMVERRAPSAFAMRCYVRSRLALDELLITYDRSTIPGYAWIFPVGGGEFNVGCGLISRDGAPPSNLKAVYESFLRSFPVAREMMAGAESSTPLRGARLRCGLTGTRPLHEGCLVAAGEAIGATFPYTGEGIGKAMETGLMAAEAAARALASGSRAPLEDFPGKLERELRPRYRGYEIAERWFGSPKINDFVVKRGDRSRFLRNKLPEIFAEREDPRVVFSAWGLVKVALGL